MPPLDAVKKHSSLDKDGRQGLYYTMSLKPNSARLFLDVQKTEISVRHISGEIVATWQLQTLADRFMQKLPALHFVSTFTEERDGIESFHFHRTTFRKGCFFCFELLNTDGWIKYIDNRNINSKTDAVAYIQKNNENPDITYWSVTLKETNIAIGLIILIKRDYLDFNDIGLTFLPTFSQKGYAYEATKAVLLNLAENNIIKNIFAITLPENKSSIKLMEKLGLKFEKIIEQNDEKLHLYAHNNSDKNLFNLGRQHCIS